MTRLANLIRRAALALTLALTPAAAFAVQPDEVLPDAKQEQRARDISEGLRCLVCQNQSIDDSNAELARELRLLVREQIKAGKSDDQVRDYLVSRYGDFILLKPPFKLDTALLWGAPFATLLIAGAFVLSRARRRSLAAPTVKPLSDDERARLDAALERESGA